MENIEVVSSEFTCFYYDELSSEAKEVAKKWYIEAIDNTKDMQQIGEWFIENSIEFKKDGTLF